VSAYHPLVCDRGDWLELDRRDELITRAEEGYRADPALARNLQEVGWTPARREAAAHGEALLVDPAEVDQHGPTLNLDRVAGEPVAQPALTAWSEFLGLHAQVNDDRNRLLGAIHTEVQAQAAEREVEILDGVPTMQVQDLAQAAAELTRLVRTLAATRAAAGVLARSGSLREQVTALDVFLASAAKAAGQEYTLLAPVESPGRRLATGSVGIRRDEPRTASPLPPAGVVLKGG
jgi:hypothetical protein